jgi:hypothetical protein
MKILNKMAMCAALVVSLGLLAACGAEDGGSTEPASDEAKTEALADCSTDLGNCYVACQNVAPTPAPECFTSCERAFDRCLNGPLTEAVLEQ